MKDLRKKLNHLKEEQAKYHEKAATLTSAEIVKESERFKKLRGEIVDILTEGAKKCPDCGNSPVGLFHDGTPKPFEVGCGHCPNHRVRGALPEDSVEDWNAGKYLPPREPGTAIATHADATGKVISQKAVKLQK
jgi:hypothetical protein